MVNSGNAIVLSFPVMPPQEKIGSKELEDRHRSGRPIKGSRSPACGLRAAYVRRTARFGKRGGERSALVLANQRHGLAAGQPVSAPCRGLPAATLRVSPIRDKRRRRQSDGAGGQERERRPS